jgi:hypothetical protein
MEYKGDTMSIKYETELIINGSPMELTEFPADFLTNVALAAVSSLQGGDDIKTLDISQDEGTTKITANNQTLTLTPFPHDAVTNTINGLLQTLKGVKEIQTLSIKIKAV